MKIVINISDQLYCQWKKAAKEIDVNVEQLIKIAMNNCIYLLREQKRRDKNE